MNGNPSFCKVILFEALIERFADGGLFVKHFGAQDVCEVYLAIGKAGIYSFPYLVNKQLVDGSGVMLLSCNHSLNLVLYGEVVL